MSVIVPIYKVEPYLRKCLDSILSQSYRRLEIILVDDGSPDNCGAICDEYAAGDERIRVIHQAHGGVAAARNAGLNKATGEWIAWVDADDWVSSEFILYLQSSALENNADIVVSGRYEVYPDTRVFVSPGSRLLKPEEAIVELIEDYSVRNYMWDKLWRAELFRGLTFPVGQNFEDLALCWKLFSRAKRVLFCPDGTYHYVIRRDSIVNTSYDPLLIFQIRQTRCEELSGQYPQLRQLLVDDCLCAALTAWDRSRPEDRKPHTLRRAQYSAISKFARQHPPKKEFMQGCSRAERLIMRLVPYDARWSLFLAGKINSRYCLKYGSDILKWSVDMKTTEKPVQRPMLHPVFPDCSEAIVFCVNDSFCPYLSVMLYSVLEHASVDRAYDIIILHRDITLENQAKLRSMAADRDNVSVRFLNVAALVNGYSLYTGGRPEFTVDTYLRLLIPYVLDDSYHKALYLDADMLAMADVGELLDVDLDGFLLASSRDLSGLAAYCDLTDNRKEYRDGVLQLERSDEYFLAGMLVLNLDAFRREYTSDALLELAASRDWAQHDQDVLNLLCKGGQAKLLHAKWDAMPPDRPELLPPAFRAEFDEALADPKIIHYGGEDKPWKTANTMWTDLFWETAVKTPYYKELISRILGRSVRVSEQNNRIAEERNRLQYDLDCVHASVSFRIGRVITWLPRKTRDGIRALRRLRPGAPR